MLGVSKQLRSKHSLIFLDAVIFLATEFLCAYYAKLGRVGLPKALPSALNTSVIQIILNNLDSAFLTNPVSDEL